MIYSANVKKAMVICCRAHQNQTDKGGMPYVFHPFHLAEQISSEEPVCAALLHDVCEDTGWTVEDLRREGISSKVLEALVLLCRQPDVPYLQYAAGLSSNPIAREVKIADLKHNMDLSRLDCPGPRDYQRAEKYGQALKMLEEWENSDQKK